MRVLLFLHWECQLKETWILEDLLARVSVIREIENVGYVFVVVKLGKNKNQINHRIIKVGKDL